MHILAASSGVLNAGFFRQPMGGIGAELSSWRCVADSSLNANLSSFEICFESSAPITSGRSGSRRPSILYTEVCVCGIPYKVKVILLLPPVIAVLQGEINTILFLDFYFMWSTSENLKRFQFTRKKKVQGPTSIFSCT